MCSSDLIAEHPLRFDAAWEGALVEQWLSAWNNELVSQPRPPAGAKVIVSGDHGIRPGRQSAALIAYTLTPAPMFWLLRGLLRSLQPEGNDSERGRSKHQNDARAKRIILGAC